MTRGVVTRLAATRLAVPVIAAAAAVVVGACGGGGGQGGGATGSGGGDDAALAALVPAVEDLTVAGTLLSWAPVEGAVTYSVTVADEDGITWMWVGEETEVEYGALPPLDDGPVEAVDPDLDLRTPLDPGHAHRWLVTAFGPDDEVLAQSAEQDLPTEQG